MRTDYAVPTATTDFIDLNLKGSNKSYIVKYSFLKDGGGEGSVKKVTLSTNDEL